MASTLSNILSDQRPIDGACRLWYASGHKATMELSSRST